MAGNRLMMAAAAVVAALALVAAAAALIIALQAQSRTGSQELALASLEAAPPPTPAPTATPQPTATPAPRQAPTPTAAPTATPIPTATPQPAQTTLQQQHLSPEAVCFGQLITTGLKYAFEAVPGTAPDPDSIAPEDIAAILAACAGLIDDEDELLKLLLDDT